MWRNWQTRRSQKPVMVTSWRFKSSHPHHFLASRGLVLFLLPRRINKGMRFLKWSADILSASGRSPLISPEEIAWKSLRLRAGGHDVHAPERSVTQPRRFNLPPITTPAAPITGPRNITHAGCLALLIASMLGTFPARFS